MLSEKVDVWFLSMRKGLVLVYATCMRQTSSKFIRCYVKIRVKWKRQESKNLVFVYQNSLPCWSTRQNVDIQRKTKKKRERIVDACLFFKAKLLFWSKSMYDSRWRGAISNLLNSQMIVNENQRWIGVSLPLLPAHKIIPRIPFMSCNTINIPSFWQEKLFSHGIMFVYVRFKLHKVHRCIWPHDYFPFYCIFYYETGLPCKHS